jgi:hypothetical protein
MQTSLSALTLEIYYRILPLFKEEAEAAAKAAVNQPAPVAKPAEKAAAEE